VTAASRSMSPPSYDAYYAYPDVFMRNVHQEFGGTEAARGLVRANDAAAWRRVMRWVTEFARAFAQRRHQLELASLGCAQGSPGRCQLCGEPGERLQCCCGRAVHRACWVATRLDGRGCCHTL